MNEIPEMIKSLAKAAIEQDKPAAVITGRVVDDTNLKIETEQKLIIDKDFIIFPKRFYSYEWSIDEDVVLIRCDGGQRYLLVDII